MHSRASFKKLLPSLASSGAVGNRKLYGELKKKEYLAFHQNMFFLFPLVLFHV